MKTMKRRIFSGAVCEQYVYNVADSVKNISAYNPERIKKERFADEGAYLKHKENISRRLHFRNVQANFGPSSIYSTLTFDDEHEVHTFPEAKIIRKRFVRALKNAYPDAVIFLYMGRGKGTDRIHFHMLSEGIPKEFISKKWKYGSVNRFSNLREHNYYNGKDCGQDYTGLANYLFDHWTEEVGGHRWMQTKNATKPDYEELTEVRIRGGYSGSRPPRCPKGYKLTEIVVAPEGYELVETGKTKYGFYYFKYVVAPPKRTRKKAAKNTGSPAG